MSVMASELRKTMSAFLKLRVLYRSNSIHSRWF